MNLMNKYYDDNKTHTIKRLMKNVKLLLIIIIKNKILCKNIIIIII